MAVTPPQILAIDLGTSGVKAALVAADGTVTGWAERPVPLRVLPGGGAEQDPLAWWDALAEVVADLGRAHPDHLRAVTTVCSSTQGEGTIAVDAAGAAADPVHHLARHAGGGQPAPPVRRVPVLRRHLGAADRPLAAPDRRHAVGDRQGPGRAHAADPRRMPEVYERTATFLNVLDWINLKLTGRTVATVDSILTSWVTDNRKASNIRYSAALVADCGIDRAKLPPIVACTEVIGTLTPERRRAPRACRCRCRWWPGAIDNTAAAVGAGTTGDNQPHLYLGTSSWIAAHVKRKKTDVGASIASVPCAVPDRYLMTALQATAGRQPDLAARQGRGVRRPAGRRRPREPGRGRRSSTPSTRIIPTVPPGANGVLYTPWLYGERAPVDDPNLRAGFLNISLDTNRSDLLRAVFEGVALNTRWLAGCGRPVPRQAGHVNGDHRRRCAVAGVVPDLRRRARHARSGGTPSRSRSTPAARAGSARSAPGCSPSPTSPH